MASDSSKPDFWETRYRGGVTPWDAGSVPPRLTRWLREQVGWRGLVRTLRQEAPFWAATLPQLPRLAHRALAEDRLGPLRDAVQRLAEENARRNDILAGALLIASIALIVLVFVAL